MWEHLNGFYHFVRDAGAAVGLDSPSDFFDADQRSRHLFKGITDVIMTHGEGWHFCAWAG